VSDVRQGSAFCVASTFRPLPSFHATQATFNSSGRMLSRHRTRGWTPHALSGRSSLPDVSRHVRRCSPALWLDVPPLLPSSEPLSLGRPDLSCSSLPRHAQTQLSLRAMVQRYAQACWTRLSEPVRLRASSRGMSTSNRFANTSTRTPCGLDCVIALKTGPGRAPGRLMLKRFGRYARAWTGESAGAHEHSGDTSPSRPFNCRYPSACSACISLCTCVVPS
jgi:hypothetical protein